jgi:hypothetical protein
VKHLLFSNASSDEISLLVCQLCLQLIQSCVLSYTPERSELRMGGIDTNIAATALAISLVAFVTALRQLFQQFLATADGYRRCQRSVMGGWAKKNRLRWRWREFRFETLYTTPEILITTLVVPLEDGVFQDGSEDAKAASHTPMAKYGILTQGHSHEMVCWCHFFLTSMTATPNLEVCPVPFDFHTYTFERARGIFNYLML